MKAPHHRGTYHRRSLALVAAANTNSSTRCWRCGLTLSEIQETKPHAKWNAGHLNDGERDGPLAPECSPCNSAGGARITNERRSLGPRSELTWP